MKRYQAGTWVSQGYYLNQASWEIQAIPRKGGVLRGPEGSIYIRVAVHPVLMPFLGVLLGGLFVLLVPFVAMPALLWFLTIKAWRKLLSVKTHSAEGRQKP